MHWHYTPYVLPLVAAAAITAALALTAWQRRAAPGAVSFAVLMLAVTEWSLGYAFELSGTALSTVRLWSNVESFGVVVIPVAWLAFALHYAGHERLLTRRTLVLLSLEPTVILVLVWANGAHGLMGSNFHLVRSGPFLTLAQTHGPAFWFNVIYSYVWVFVGTLLLSPLFQARIWPHHLYRRQATLVLVGAFAPWVGNVLFLTGLTPLPHLDPTPFAFTVTGLTMGWSLFRFRLLDIVPVARNAVIESMSDAIVVLDAQGRVIDLNPAARTLVPRAAEAIGQTADVFFAGQPDLLAYLSTRSEALMEITLGVEATRHSFDLRISPLHDRSGNLTGQLIVLRNVTERKQAEQDLRASEARFRLVFEESPIGMALIGLDDRVLKVNQAFADMLGYTERELTSLTTVEITHPDDRSKDALLAAHARSGAITSYKVEKRYCKKNGEPLWADLTTTLIRDQAGQPLYTLSMLENAFERKRAELLEAEQRHVAYELHDGLAQVAASVHQHLQAFASHYHPRSTRARQELERALELAQRAVREARRTIAGLRPTMLDDMGLAAALRLEAETLRTEGWTITYIEALGLERLPPAIEIALFRVAQEALTNVRKHAGTSRVHLSLRRQEATIHLEVRDWGCGFRLPAVSKAAGPGERVGLREIRERVAFLGGQLRIESEPGAGTRVVAEVSLPAAVAGVERGAINGH